MADLSSAAWVVMLTALRGVAVFASVHTADPGATGLNEVTGGSPAYARKAITWAAVDPAGILDTSTVLTFDVPAGTYRYWGLWSAATSGTWYGSAILDIPETFAAQGKLRILTGAAVVG